MLSLRWSSQCVWVVVCANDIQMMDLLLIYLTERCEGRDNIVRRSVSISESVILQEVAQVEGVRTRYS
jgi:hypothetical protein